MVSLDDAVLARLEKGGNRYEILVDPELVDDWKGDPDSVSLDELLAIDEVWSDAKGGDRPTSEALERVFGTTDLTTCVTRILSEGSIQLTTMQRRRMVEEKKRQIVNQITSTATDPKTRLPHPLTRIENALEEIRFPIDPFKSTESQVEDAVAALRPLIPLQFITIRLAFKVQGRDYGGVHQMLRDSVQREEWLSDGTWACVVSVPGGMKNDLISKVAARSSDVEVRELD
ncbi:MAG: ribosome assembly factor SBDS [Candidatus Thalassarchaeaceae archaeon]|jgi:ribosome maturation protein SDO1|nr:ribosome assembly factor SBDS [Euryarchaeota archaeon]MDP6220300.1 ribosome assembly factor SBDS [Candidatus Thalassarchaeaceae archaeon]MBV43825.1 ribosome assembly factor SBDS [Euryarchaeota archaeon]MDP7092175.1 ribosome assembly factor SBDS [Candidatus Thalassarchaeaceae archaeon]MDP7256664.1 ribosome assembly factor SBDS [Candidatus Thalassarchaeaceae archaeon]|tara:strand:- start:59 stop:748 length:690 start_codon:yes stop_codon:yes gene_type:complete